MRRVFRLPRLLLMLLCVAPVFSIPVQAAPPAFSTHAEAAAVIDVSSGRILFSQQGDKTMRIASLTKVMTAIVAIEQGKLSDRVKISARAAGKEGSSLYLKAGQEMSLQDLLYGLMLRSGNDAATAIAEHIGGSVEGFAYLMNQKAQMLGMSHSHFMNPSGLDEEGHYSTANDMARLTAYALHNPVFREIVKTKVKKAPNPEESWDYVWSNKNKMLSLYDGADGVKTGYTKLAGRCLISSATRGVQQIAVVTLNDGDDWADHARALDFAFRYYPLVKLSEKGEQASNSALVTGDSFSYPLTEEEKGKVTRKVETGDPLSINYRFGELGRLRFQLEGREIGSVPLVAGDTAKLNPTHARTGPEGPDPGRNYAGRVWALVRALFSFDAS
jgi:D-alanyl-D-alanine carboxypeptidase